MSLSSRPLRRYRVLLALLLLAAVLVWVPMVPHSPYCWGRHSVGNVFLVPAYSPIGCSSIMSPISPSMVSRWFGSGTVWTIPMTG